MSKIGLLTVHCSVNFGAALQAYALKKYLEERNNNVEIINYRFDKFIGLHDYSHRKTLSLKYLVKKYLFFNQTYGRYSKFLEFETDYMGKESELISDSNDMGLLNGKYDLYIVGSDQLWNPQHTDFDSNYFFEPVVTGIRASFAASIGKGVLSEAERRFISENIGHIDYISVREKSGKKLLNSISSQLDVEVLMDPVALLSIDKWRTLERAIDAKKKYLKEKYVLAYFPGEFDQALLEYIIDDLRKKEFQIVFLKYKIRGNFGDYNIYDAGPREFLYLLDNASIVLTNSFHGSLFSIMFEKEIISLESKGKNERLSDLFQQFGISNIQIKTLDDYKKNNWIIDYEKMKHITEKILSDNRKKVDRYLTRIGA